MTVAELIDALKKLPADADVIMWGDEPEDEAEIALIHEPCIELDDDGDVCIDLGAQYAEGEEEEDEAEEEIEDDGEDAA